MKSQEEAHFGGRYRYKAAHRSVWVQRMINSHTHMALYGPCLKIFHLTDLTFSSLQELTWKPEQFFLKMQSSTKSPRVAAKRGRADPELTSAHGIVSTGRAEHLIWCPSKETLHPRPGLSSQLIIFLNSCSFAAQSSSFYVSYASFNTQLTTALWK